MKKSAAFISNRIPAIVGRLMLIIYKAYSSLFIKKADFIPPFTQISTREIILVKRTGKVYKVAAKEYALS